MLAMAVKIINDDALSALKQMPDKSVHCCVTSPPYWGLRDYGIAGQLGLEKTPGEYVEKMVEIFHEVRRVLRDDGTLWLVIGDSYATGAGKVGDCPGGGEQGERWKGYKGSRGGHEGKHSYLEGQKDQGMAVIMGEEGGAMMNPYRMERAEPKGRDVLLLGWGVVRILLFIAYIILVVLAVTVLVGSIARMG